jgi:hypothetical protein
MSRLLTVVGAGGLLLFGLPAFARGQSGWFTVRGRVVLAGDSVPEPKPLPVNKDEGHCLSKGPIYSEELLVNKGNHGVRWAFVWLAPVNKNGPPLPVFPGLQEVKEKQIFIDQPCCMFVPHALAIRQGQEVISKNSSPINHNVNWTGHPLKNPGGNKIVGPGQSLTIDGLKADRLPVKVACNIHGWMTAWIRIFDHPYFALTDENGRFEIKQAPVGNWLLVAWHEKVGWVTPRLQGGEPGMPITIKNDDVDVGKIELVEKKQ